MYQEIEQYGGLTTIKVYGAGSEDMMGYSMGGEDQEASEEYVDDHCIETLGKIEHVESAQPVYQMSVLLLKGSYEGYTELLAMTPEGRAQLLTGTEVPYRTLLPPASLRPYLPVVGAVVTVIVLKQRKKKKDKDEEEELLYELDGTSEDEQQ